MNNKCRVCYQNLYVEPLLKYENMPKSAQFFPDLEALAIDKGKDLDVYQCSGCGLVQLSNEPVHYYREVIRAAGISDEMTVFRLQEFAKWIEQYNLNRKRIIEIGCGQGEYLSILQQLDIEVFGIEFGESAVEQCKQKDLNVERLFIEQQEQTISEAPFDGFVMLNFLEHLPDPNSTLKGIAHNLVEGAIGLVEVPNFDMILRENMFSEFISDHLFYFTRETFISTLTRNGFEVLECKETWHDYSLSAVVRKRSKTNLTVFAHYQKELTETIDSYLKQFSDHNVAIWGAGHQALAVMSLTHLGPKIKYVVDSAPFKQNKFTPATHIPIVSPDRLCTDPVDAVIVMAASYSDEVVKILRTKYGHIENVSVLNSNELQIV